MKSGAAFETRRQEARGLGLPQAIPRQDRARKLRLSKLDPSDTGKLKSEDDAKEEAEHYLKELARQQVLLYAEHKHSVLVVLQAMDAGGKDGTIRHVFSGVNPQGVDVASFKQPTPLEACA